MSKEAFKAKKMTGFWFYPEDLVIITDKSDPLYDPRALTTPDESFIRNIAYHGVKEPVLITKREDGLPVVVAGRRRTLAAREANKRSIEQGGKAMQVPCKYERGTEDTLFEIMIFENEHRRDDTPIEKAEKANRMLSMGRSNKEVAEAFGVTQATIKNWLELLTLPKETRKQILDGTVKPTNAIKAKRLPEKQKRVAIAPFRMRKKKEIFKLREQLSTGEKSMSAIDVLNWVLNDG